MPQSYLNVLNTYSSLNEICGSRINLWGYFLAICDDILMDNGILAFVIPINFFRGRATEKIRDHILKNYRIKYVVKTGKDTAFSEDSAFRDILLIAEKVKPKLTDTTRFIILNEKLHSLSINDSQKIANFITGKSFTSSNNLDIIDFKHKDLLEFQNNLMPLFGVMQTKSSKIFFKFNQLISRRFGKKLRKLNSNEISEGFHASPKGISQMAFITKNFGKNRVKRDFLILKNERKEISSLRRRR
jgi:hypothetical protein